MGQAPTYPLLSRIETPADLRDLPRKELAALVTELRQYLIQTVSERGGHFAAGLGTVELLTIGWFGMSVIRPTRTRFSPAGATDYALSNSRMDSRLFRAGRKANSIPLVWVIRAPRSAPRSAWRSALR
jgi:1-deoxy-D-xylulose-5-phosphate synthase